MARAAVKAKQQAKAKAAQTAKPSRARARRGHAGGGNPNQQLFFIRLRRGQKWLYALLAIVFAATFAGVGVGSGSGGLSDLWTGLFGGGGNPVSDARKEIQKNPAKGYHDLARAYESNGDNASAITALQSYVGIRKKDPAGWSELGSLQLSQAQTYIGQYQQVQQAAQLADPSQPFVPSTGQLSGAFSNPAQQFTSQQATSQATQLYQQASTALTGAVHDYQQAAKLQPHNAQAWFNLGQAAQQAGDTQTELKAFKRYLVLYPHSPYKTQISQLVKSLEPAKKK